MDHRPRHMGILSRICREVALLTLGTNRTEPVVDFLESVFEERVYFWKQQDGLDGSRSSYNA